MNIYRRKIVWKLALLISAIIIGVGSLLYTSKLVDQLKAEERKKVKHWAESIRLVEITNEDPVLNFLSSIIESNNTVPVILTDEMGSIVGHKNFDPEKTADSLYLEGQLDRLKSRMDPLIISFGDNMKSYIYYNESIILTKLIYYPYIQLLVIIFFIAVAYFAFSMSRRAEQNQVWVGMSKETAHQLGTPISSLAAWIELLKEKYPDDYLHGELSKDLARLEKITERFSKIGSKPELIPLQLIVNIENSIDYLKNRSSSKVEYITNFKVEREISVPLNASLFEWVMENLFKNAIDAMNGEGQIRVDLNEVADFIYIDVTDTGKGIPKAAFKTIFKPGFSTKERGWGLGLSLSKRIIEIYHHGRIYVKSSEPGKGTSIRISLRKQGSKN